MTFQTHGMEVCHQKPYSGCYGAHAKVFESQAFKVFFSESAIMK